MMPNLPEGLQKYAGRILDVDSHEMIPAQAWVPTFGPELQPLVDSWLANGESEANNRNHPNVPEYPGDVMAIDANVNNVKGCRAPGAADPLRRLAVMDVSGISKQLMFPGVSAYAMLLAINAENTDFMAGVKKDRRAVAERWMQLYDRWSFEVVKKTDRIRPVVPIIGTTVQELTDKAKHQIDNGIRALWVPSGTLPGGVSPAHSDLDPFWKTVADANCVINLHIGAEAKFFETRAWGDAPVFADFKFMGEFNGDPWTLSSMHLPSQNFLSTMVLGGVFERHPHLRLGVIELGAFWIGPLMEALDVWYDNSKTFNLRNKRATSERPSVYIRRNVKATPFAFEDVAHMITKYDLADILCFSTDYPHVEGGKNIFETMYNNLAPLGNEVMEKFFVKNGEWLLPA